MRRLPILGVDILERKKARAFLRSHSGRLAEMFFPSEISYFRRSSDKVRAFGRLFAAKEAAMKAFGEGLFSAQTMKGYRVVPGRTFSVRSAKAGPLKVSFKEDRRRTVAVCHPACAGN